MHKRFALLSIALARLALGRRAARVKHHLMNTGLSRRLQAGWRPFAGTELLNKGIKRCAGVVGIFPNDAAITRLVGAVLLEQDEHWQLEGRRMFSLDSMATILAAADELPPCDPATTTTA
jgi:hypothetical protein